MSLSPERQANADERFWILRSFGLDPRSANQIAVMLEYRCQCHERVGGVAVIYDEMWMSLEAHRWGDLYRRALEFLEAHHVERIRGVLERLAVSVA